MKPFFLTNHWLIGWQVSEIAFINTLEAQNRRIQVLRRHQVSGRSLEGVVVM